jgi:hypothetical protein
LALMSTMSPTLEVCQSRSKNHPFSPSPGLYSLVHLEVGVQGDHALAAEVPAEGILRPC